jgi:hypothetical protein
LAYFPNNPIFFTCKGKDFELGFSKHAIDRYYERCIIDLNSYTRSQVFFQYVNKNLYIEKIDEDLAALYRPLFPDIDLDKSFIKAYSNIDNPEHSKYEFLLKIGYAPLHFDFGNVTAKCKTILLPGMRNTPEKAIFLNRDGCRTPFELDDLKHRFELMCSSLTIYDNLDKYSFQYYFHIKGFKQFF